MINIKNTTLPLFLLISTLEAGIATYLTEAFSCEVALANYHHLTKTTKQNNPPLKLTIEELTVHSECEVK